MKLPKEKTSGKVYLNRTRFLVYGPPKIGKSTFGSGFPHTLFLATEKGYQALKIYVKDIKSWPDFISAVDLIVEGKHNFENIIIDTIDILSNLCTQFTCKKFKIDHISETTFAKAYDFFKSEFDRELNRLFLTDYGIILLSHVKVSEITSKGFSTTKITNTLPNRARSIIGPKVDSIGYIKIKSVKNGDKYVTRRVITFKPTELEDVGDRTGRLLDEEVILYKDPSKTYKKLKSYFDDK